MGDILVERRRGGDNSGSCLPGKQLPAVHCIHYGASRTTLRWLAAKRACYHIIGFVLTTSACTTDRFRRYIVIDVPARGHPQSRVDGTLATRSGGESSLTGEVD